MMSEGRRIAEERMIASARQMGTNAITIICARHASASVRKGARETLAYGTAARHL